MGEVRPMTLMVVFPDTDLVVRVVALPHLSL
jgi:hypothetical protein